MNGFILSEGCKNILCYKKIILCIQNCENILNKTETQMKKVLKKLYETYSRWDLEILTYCLIASLIFPITLYTSPSVIIENSNFTKILFYLSDIIFLFLYLRAKRKFEYRTLKVAYLKLLIIFLLYLSTFYVTHLLSNALFVYYFLLILLGIVTYETTGILFKNFSTRSKIRISYIFIGLCILQSCISIIQWKTQQPVGLSYLGEPRISRETPGIAKVKLAQDTYIRPYGTFSHPNLLSLYILFSLILLIYIKTYWSKISFVSVVSIVLLTYVLTITLSRVPIVIWNGYLFTHILYLVNQKTRNILKKAPIVLAIGIIGTFLIFNFSVFMERFNFQDSSKAVRANLNLYATQIIHESPIFGVGPGQSLLHMQQMRHQEKLEFYSEPIHNFWLIIWSEWGIFILIPIIFLLLKNISHSIWLMFNKNYTSEQPYVLFSAFSVLVIIAILSFFDHYFYTSRQGLFIFWSTLAIISKILQNQSSIHVTSDSEVIA